MKRIVLTGGGTGGHITPLLAVAHQLKQQDPDCKVIYVGERNGKFAHMAHEHADIDEVHQVFAGKFRRYHGESWFKRLLDVKTNLLNIRDAFYVLLGMIQALFLVPMLKPDMILLKGGFVGVPIGLAAAFWRKPFITHDSDAIPGLANRMVSRWAKYHATGMPPEFYSYPQKSIQYVGVLVGPDYIHVTPDIQSEYKQQLGISDTAEVLTITGGSSGATTINRGVRAIISELLEARPNLHVVHQVGVGKGYVYNDFSHERLKVFELLKPMHAYTGAADIVVTRAGANTMAELGVQGKACIVIPNPLLTGGHQLKNAEVWEAKEAALLLDESELVASPNNLLVAINELLDDEKSRKQLGDNLEALTAKDASRKLAAILLNPDKNESVQT